MWNDNDEPLAFLITFRTYGTWLHGDERGSVNRFHNKFGSARIKHEPSWLDTNRRRLKLEPVTLNARQRGTTKKAIKQTCKIRKWMLLAVNVRTNHVHAVVRAPGKKASVVLNALKANSTRLMCERGLWSRERSPWVDKGSTRYLWNGVHVNRACNYVEHGQGDDLPEFE